MYSHAMARAQMIDRERAFGRESFRPTRSRVTATSGLARVSARISPRFARRPARVGRIDRFTTPIATQS